MVSATKARSTQAKQIVDRSVDGEWFIEHVLGHRMWDIPRSIIRDLAQPRAMVSVKSCHASGKTFTAADAAIWFTAAMRGITLVTSPSWTQVEQQIWGEIHKTFDSARFPLGGELLKTEWRIAPMNYALGMATNDGIRMQGFHGRMLVIVDEAPGVRPDILHAIEGMRAGGDVRVLLMGNPNDEMSAFRETFTSGKAVWKNYTIDGLHTPNMKGITLDDLIAIPYDDEHKASYHPVLDGGDPFFSQHLINRRFIWEKYHTWGVNNPLWVAKVRGDFPDAGTDTLVSLVLIDRARDAVPPPLPEGRGVDIGIDVAGPGEDETVLQARCGPVVFPPLSWADPDPRGEAIAVLAEYARQGTLGKIKVDSVGQGYYFGKHLEDCGYKVHFVNVGEKAYDREKFANLKAEAYWGLRQRFEDGDIYGLTDEVTQAQLASLKYHHTPRGQVEIESKQKARNRGVKSPDRAEALMLAFYEPPSWDDGEPLAM